MSGATPEEMAELLAEMREVLRLQQLQVACIEAGMPEPIGHEAEPIQTVVVRWHGDVYDVPENVLRACLREVTTDERD